MTTTTKTTTKLSKTSKSIHQKWQIEAERKGGKGAKVVLIQSNAKKLIYNLLKDSFRPMNITSIYEVRFSLYIRRIFMFMMIVETHNVL